MTSLNKWVSHLKSLDENIMKTAILFLSGLAFCTAVSTAEAPRLMLWITDPIGVTNGTQCQLPENPTTIPSLPAGQPTLTEQDLIG